MARNSNIPIHWWPSEGGGTDGAKSKFVEQRYASKFLGKGNHVFCILTDKEPVRTFACRQLISKAGKPYERVYDCRKPVKQYYIYLHDALLGGPCYLKISSYLPFRAEFYFNGHNAIQLQLNKQNVKYRLNENAFVDVENPEVLQKAAASLSGRIVLNRINYWLNIFFKFDKGKYSTRSKFLYHDWYMSQVEISSNIVFQSARFCTSLFERLLDKFHRLGLPDTIAQIFNRRPHRRSISKTFWRLYDNNACIKHWFRGNSIKQYNKTGYYIRTETTINNPKSLGLQKPVLYLQAYLWEGVECNDRFLDWNAVPMWISPQFQKRKRSFTQSLSQIILVVTSPRRISERIVRLLWQRNCSSQNTMHTGSRQLICSKTFPNFSEILHKSGMK